MPRDGSGIYTTPVGTTATPDTTIESAKYNANVNDVAADLNAPRPIVAGGTGANNANDAAINLGVVSGKTAITYTDAEKAVARSNIAAAPFDALAYNGMQINGSMEVSQEIGTGAVTVGPTGTGTYVVDGWKCRLNTAGAGRAVAGQIPLTTEVAGIKSALNVYTSVTQAVMTGPTDFLRLQTDIEGYRFSRAGWGTPAAIPVTIGFWMRASLTGTYRAVMINSAGTTNTPWMPFTITAAALFQWVTITFPAVTTGTWLTTNGTGAGLIIEVASDATPNILASLSGYAAITGVVVLPGTQAPTAAQSPLIMRPYDQELVTCQRYLYKRNIIGGKYIATLQAYSATSAAGFMFDFPVTMRAAPTASYPFTSNLHILNSSGAPIALSVATVSTTVDYATMAPATGAGGLVAGNAAVLYAFADTWLQFDARL